MKSFILNYMVIYNTTFNVEESEATEWQAWLKDQYIPMLYDTGLFVKHIFSRVLVEEEMGGLTFSLQLFLPSMLMLRAYEDNYRDALDSSMMQKFKGKFVMFKTILEVYDEQTA